MKTKLWMAGLFLLGAVANGFGADKSTAVAVLDFSVPAAEGNRWGWAEGGMADLLQIELQQHGMLLVDRDAIHAVLREQRLAADGHTAQGYLTLAKLLNAQQLVAGKVIPLADGRFRVEASAFSVEAVETVVTASSEGEFPKEMSPVLQSVAKQLAGKLQTSSAPDSGVERPAAGPKPEALVMFYRGLNACAAGLPEQSIAYFMNAASLDSDFTIPLLWEIKAYEIAGLPAHAAIRRKELAGVLKSPVMAVEGTNNADALRQPVLAVLDPIVKVVGTVDAALLAGRLKHALLEENRVRVFAYEGINTAVAEQDLRLSSFFANQNAPRYGRWLTADALLLCQVSPAESGLMSVELSLINPLNATIMKHIQRTISPDALTGQAPFILKELVSNWLNHVKHSPAAPLDLGVSVATAERPNLDLRPVYQNLITTLSQVRREQGKGESHRNLAAAFAATGRSSLAALEIERYLQTLDTQATNADWTYFSIYCWLKASPEMVGPSFLNLMKTNLLVTYPQSLAAGCVHYEEAIKKWKSGEWTNCIAQARMTRQIILPLAVPSGRDVLAAAYYLEGASLGKIDRKSEAEQMLRQGLACVECFKVDSLGLPSPHQADSDILNARICNYQPPGLKVRIEQELDKLQQCSVPSTTVVSKRDGQNQAAVTNALAKKPDASADWIQKGGLEYRDGHFQQALNCYQKAVALGVSATDCPNLAAAVLEVALDRNLEQLQPEIQKIRREMGFPPGEAGWAELFTAGRKFQTQTGDKFRFEKAAACYRGALAFLEAHFSNNVTFCWGPLNSQQVNAWDARWYSAAFYLSQCCINLDQKVEAAQWLRQIAIKVGGDSGVPLLDWDHGDGNGASWSSSNLGRRAGEMLNTLHQDQKLPSLNHANQNKFAPASTSKP